MNSIGFAVWGLSTILATAPPGPSGSERAEGESALSSTESRAQRPEKRSQALFISSGAVLGLALVGEVSSAIVSTRCSPKMACTKGFVFTWGSDEAGSRYTLMTSGPGTAYVAGRVISTPLVWLGAGLLLGGAQAIAERDHLLGTRWQGNQLTRKRVGWGLLGGGLGLYVASRLLRLGLAVRGACQSPACVYGIDQSTLGMSRGLMLTGSALLVHHRVRQKLQLQFGAPSVGWGIAVRGVF